ncbi:MAG TPA: MFS transporter [Anaerolineaceae bacterium]|nr:MFS transporter [Anaerolineaceae bacterium]
MQNSKPRLILFIACCMFLAFGMFNAAIGPVLGELAANTNSTLVMVGGVITFLFLGSLAAQLIAGPITDKIGLRVVVLASLLLVAFGLPAFTNVRSYPLMLALVLITGLGQGGIDLSANLMVSGAYPKNTTPMLNLLHFFFGLGAFFGPALVGLSIAATGSGMIIQWVAAGIFLLLAFIVFGMRDGNPPASTISSVQPAEVTGQKSVYLSPFMWVIGLLILIYVGAEYGLGSWATRYMGLTAGMAEQNGALVTSAYWGALTLGRLAGAAASRRLDRTRLLGIALIGSFIGTLGLILSPDSVLLTIIFIIVTGFSFGTIYPTSVAVTVAQFPNNQGKAVGLLAALGSIGGLTLPWLAGILLETVSPLVYGIFLFISVVILLLLLFALGKLKKEPIQ